MIEGRIDPVHGAVIRLVIDNPSFRKADPELAGELGIGVPRPVRGFGVLDTGASMSCVIGEVASSLSLLAVDAVEMRGVRAPHEHARQDYSRVRYGVLRLDGVPGEFPTGLVEIRSLGEFDGRRIIALVGRDVLQHAELAWHGAAGVFRLAFPGRLPAGHSSAPGGVGAG